jgi:hypothetical protein
LSGYNIIIVTSVLITLGRAALLGAGVKQGSFTSPPVANIINHSFMVPHQPIIKDSHIRQMRNLSNVDNYKSVHVSWHFITYKIKHNTIDIMLPSSVRK